jgi:hypothetical protein
MVLAATACAGTASAQSFDRNNPVSDRQLDSIRGGFDIGGGLLGSFGIDRATYINGQLVAHSQVTIPDIAHITTQQAAALAVAMQTNVIRNGPGNVADLASFSSAPGSTVIQNSLDGQNIQNRTTINATVNTLPLFNALNLQETLQAGAMPSLGH